jgi:hypothetical protein
MILIPVLLFIITMHGPMYIKSKLKLIVLQLAKKFSTFYGTAHTHALDRTAISVLLALKLCTAESFFVR